MAPLADARGVQLTGRLDSAVPEVAVSTPEVSRVLRNLLDNAIRHTTGEGTVTVAAGVEDGHAYVSAADGCGGLPDGDPERAFDVAFRGESARPSDGGGGLGLAIAPGMVEAAGGEITVRNADSGCRFVVRLPLRRRDG